MWNLTVVCSAHHAALHEGLLSICGRAPDALEFAWRGRRSVAIDRDHEAWSPDSRGPDLPALDELIPNAGGEEIVLERADNHWAKINSGEVRAERDPERQRHEPSKQVARAGSRCRFSDGVVKDAPFAGAAIRRSDPARPDARSGAATIDNDARVALETAGFRPREAREAVESARPHVGASATLEQVIREALRRAPAVARSFAAR